MIPAMQIDSKPGFSPAWTHAGYACLVLLAILSLRAVYEETILTWLDGPPLVRFTVFHSIPYLLTAGLIGTLGGLI
ncbi:MAG: hypothetical protein WA209_03250 [Candidatus Acidiferrales bacterium]